MKLRAALGILAVAVTVTACGSSSPPSGPAGSGDGVVASDGSSPTGDAPAADASAASAGSGGGSAFCTNLVTAEQRLSNIEQSVSGGDLDQAKKAIDAQIGTFQQLSKSAPGEVKPALEDIVELLKGAEQALTDPAHPDSAGLSALGTKMPGDLNALGNYVANNCQGN